MICHKCNQDKKTGKVISGEFICTFCNKQEKVRAEEGIVRYASAKYAKKPMIVSAKYKETKSFWVRLEYEPGWPFDEKIHKTYHQSPPGYDAKQEVFNSLLKHAIGKRKDYMKALAEAEERILDLKQFSDQEGYSYAN